ncbi:MAG: F-box-like [Chlamydiales bacterium]|nr:F-box-like [Chlamydiales bacterium]
MNTVSFASFQTLPAEIKEEVFSYLDQTSLGRTSQVCKDWNHRTSSDRVWQHLINTKALDILEKENLSLFFKRYIYNLLGNSPFTFIDGQVTLFPAPLKFKSIPINKLRNEVLEKNSLKAKFLAIQSFFNEHTEPLLELLEQYFTTTYGRDQADSLKELRFLLDLGGAATLKEAFRQNPSLFDTAFNRKDCQSFLYLLDTYGVIDSDKLCNTEGGLDKLLKLMIIEQKKVFIKISKELEKKRKDVLEEESKALFYPIFDQSELANRSLSDMVAFISRLSKPF